MAFRCSAEDGIYAQNTSAFAENRQVPLETEISVSPKTAVSPPESLI
jgi:hypothetical protein